MSGKHLALKVSYRLKFAYTQKTWKSYKNMFCLFLAFCFYFHLKFKPIHVNSVLMFIEYLIENGLQPASVRNYITAVAMYCKWLNLQVEAFYDTRVNLMFKALARSIYKPPTFKAVFHPHDLEKIIKMCTKFQYPLIFQTLYIFAYFGFLRIFNLVPPSVRTFNIKKHLARGDVFPVSDTLILLVKWSKTLQASNQGSYIVLPTLTNTSICPFYHFTLLQQFHPTSTNSPCFPQIPLW